MNVLRSNLHGPLAVFPSDTTMKTAQVMPSKIRSTPTVNAFLASLPQMLDYNFALGETLLLNTILVLQKLPFPPRYASSWQQSHTLMQESHLFQGCGFSLWYLEPSLRKNWLLATVVIFYKVTKI